MAKPDNNEPLLIRKRVSELTGLYRIPSYQRGYRWEPLQVTQLLNDLKDFTMNPKKADKPYYLQPIVVATSTKEVEESQDEEQYDFDLIDGQQRLTTIYLLFKALDYYKKMDASLLTEWTAKGMDYMLTRTALANSLKNIDTSLGYGLTYQTRESTRGFLKEIDTKAQGDYDVVSCPDHLYIWHAYQTILNWIALNSECVGAIAKRLHEDVKIINYRLPDDIKVDSWKKFTDLNAGKIPLTNSELIKALFLNQEKGAIPDYEQSEIVSQWDRIERELHDPEFWSFLTRKKMDDYATKIDLLFDLFAGKTDANRKDEYFTFNYFQRKFDEDTLKGGKEKWENIFSQYQRLHDWFTDPWFYHRIGYLIAVGNDSTLIDIFHTAYPEDAPALKPSEFRVKVDEMIKGTMQLPEGLNDISELHYEKHKDQIHKILTLYNVMLCNRLSKHGVRYPFFCHHADENGGWSLEHVHAQNSELLSGAKQWKEWVADHLDSLRRLSRNPLESMVNFNGERADRLMEKMELFIADKSKEKLKDRFDAIVSELSELTVSNDSTNDDDQKHLLANMALLSRDDNSSLNKSTFDVKRMRIAEKISSNYVPLGTERVFMKSINGCDSAQMFYWSDLDREAYLQDIHSVLDEFLPKHIIADNGE